MYLCPCSKLFFEHRMGSGKIPAVMYLFPSHGQTKENHTYTYLHYASSLDLYKYSFFPRNIITWNKLPALIVEAPSLEAFKEG